MGIKCTKTCPPATAQTPAQVANQTFYNIPNACGPAGTAARYAKCPTNGEWTASETGDTCQFDSAGAPCSMECGGSGLCGTEAGHWSVGHCQWEGRKIACKRKPGAQGYQGDAVKCCETGAAIQENKTCDIKYRNPESSACVEALRQHCSQGNNINSARCSTWCGKHANACLPIMKNYCSQGGNFKNKKCQSWCGVNASTKAACDAIATTFCGPKAKSDPWCACFDASPDIPRPWCFDTKCAQGNVYKTETMKKEAANCGTFCSQVVDVRGAKSVLLDNVQFQQSCPSQHSQLKTDATTPPPTLEPKTGGTTSPPTTGGTTFGGKLSKNTIIGLSVGGGVVVLLIIILIMYMILF